MDTAFDTTMNDLAMTQLRQVPNLPRMTGRTEAEIDKTAQDFEGVFVGQMLQPMFDGLHVDGLFGGGHGEEVMRSMMVQEFGKMIAKTGKFGIADAVKKNLMQKSGLSPQQTTILQGVQNAG